MKDKFFRRIYKFTSECIYYLRMSEIYKLETALGAACEREIEKIFTLSHCPYDKKTSQMGAAYEIASREIFVDASVEILTSFYKKKEMNSVLEEDGTIGYYAFLGTVLSVERDAERQELVGMIKDRTALNLDGFTTFNISDVRAAWRGVGKIAGRLYGACRDEDDKISLILYLLDLQEKRGQRIRVEKDGLQVGKTKKRFIGFCEDDEKNLFINLFLHRPETIEITPDLLPSTDSLRFLRKIMKNNTMQEIFFEVFFKK